MGSDAEDETTPRRRRPPPDRRAGPTRALSERAARFVGRASAIDRRARYERRRREVTEQRRTRRRRQLATVVLGGGSTVIALIVVGASGVAALGPGRSADQATFSVLDHSAGRFFSGDDPSKFGPRHWAQFAAAAPPGTNIAATVKATKNFACFIICFVLFGFGAK
jgi:hypothetical protein